MEDTVTIITPNCDETSLVVKTTSSPPTILKTQHRAPSLKGSIPVMKIRILETWIFLRDSPRQSGIKKKYRFFWAAHNSGCTAITHRHHPELKQTNQIAEKPVDDHLRCVLKENPKMQIRMKYKYKYKYKLHKYQNTKMSTL